VRLLHIRHSGVLWTVTYMTVNLLSLLVKQFWKKLMSFRFVFDLEGDNFYTEVPSLAHGFC
jgi:hypothetical protein